MNAPAAMADIDTRELSTTTPSCERVTGMVDGLNGAAKALVAANDFGTAYGTAYAAINLANSVHYEAGRRDAAHILLGIRTTYAERQRGGPVAANTRSADDDLPRCRILRR